MQHPPCSHLPDLLPSGASAKKKEQAIHARDSDTVSSPAMGAACPQDAPRIAGLPVPGTLPAPKVLRGSASPQQDQCSPQAQPAVLTAGTSTRGASDTLCRDSSPVLPSPHARICLEVSHFPMALPKLHQPMLLFAVSVPLIPRSTCR